MADAAVSLSLIGAAAGVAFLHTALGPDHYLPFIMLARARGWSLLRTAAVTAACGVGHVLSSLVLGGVGIAVGVAISRIEGIEGGRGELAAWALVAFGVAYAAWGVRLGLRRRRGLEPHAHGHHVHVHALGDHSHAHDADRPGRNPTFWALLIVFVLGPCEPLIPLFVLPASRGEWGLAVMVGAVFGAVTVGTMVAVTLVGAAGLARVRGTFLERWVHTLAGATIAAAGLSVLFLGL